MCIETEAKLTGKTLHNSIETALRGVDYNKVHIEPRISGIKIIDINCKYKK